MPDTAPSTPRRTLNGWKEIAAYLGKSVRSVQRWEVAIGLPVHRIKTPDGQIVYAKADEIDIWRHALDQTTVDERVPPAEPHLRAVGRGQPREPTKAAEPPSPTSWRRYAWMVAAGIIILAAGVAWGRRQASQPQTPMDFRIGGDALEALGLDGTVLWTYRFNRTVSEITERLPRLGVQFLDVDRDGSAELLAFVRFAQKGRPGAISDGLFCFTRDGTLKWSVIPDQTLSFRGQSYSAPWRIQDFVASDTPGQRRLWIALAHNTWWPSFVLEIDDRGTAQLRYVQGGRIFALAHWVTPAEGVLAVGGVTNETLEATLALLKDSDPAASFPSRGDGDYGCLDCPEGRPKRVFLFAAAGHAELFPRRHPLVTNLAVAGAELMVSLDAAVEPPGMHAVATIGPNQIPRSVRFSDAYWKIHRELEHSGQIDHTVEECPDRERVRTVREWSPDGWREFHVQADPTGE